VTNRVELRVSVPDRPGVIAEVATLAGRLGIYIANLDTADSVEGGGVLVIVIEATGADAYESGLRELGYEVTRSDGS